MSINRYLLGALSVAGVSVIYHYLVFSIFAVHVDFVFDFFGDSEWAFFLFAFVKNFFVGLILMVLFTHAYKEVLGDQSEKSEKVLKGAFFFSLYGIFALISFTIGDYVLMGSNEGVFVLVTVDGVVETFIATIPVKFFVFDEKKA